jgi:hypothetical protein
MDRAISTPTKDEFHFALIWFVSTLVHVISRRSRTFGPRRFQFSSSQLGREFSTRLGVGDLREIADDFAEAEEFSSLGFLYEELLYICWKYGRAVVPEQEAELEGAPRPKVERLAAVLFQEEDSGGIFGEGVVDDIDTVKGSIDTLLKKLPKWAHRIIEVLLEVLKLTRGV